MKDLRISCRAEAFHGMRLILWRFNLLFILA